MTYRKIVLMLIAALVIVGGSHGLRLINRDSSSPVPASISVGLEGPAPAPGMKTTDEMIKFWQARFERDPRDFISLTFLGDALIRKARETGDVSEYERADATLQQALKLHPNYEVAQAYLSVVQYVKHDFLGALDLASQVYAAHPNAVQALATIGDAQLELGHYTEAETTYKKLNEKSPSAPVYTRLARLAWLQGQRTEAFNWMQQAITDSDETGLSGENSAWYHFQLGELYFNTGQLEKADAQYTLALKAFDNYYLALAGRGKVRAAHGDYKDAITFYEQAVRIIPQPDLLAALGDLYALTGDSVKAKQEYDIVEFIGKLQAINQVIYNRQLALFYANHNRNLDKSLVMAQKELENRKDIYAYDTYAWALYKNNHYSQAAEMIKQAMELGTHDAMLYYHAGMIYRALGEDKQAEQLLSQALAINPHFDLIQAPIARQTLIDIYSQIKD
ncbi:MAG TPA: tetratricopeptide repeat protein [Anaerolineales bacterium]|nr:tetratricopeptide repeat protein [Anaerolineales bacterium]